MGVEIEVTRMDRKHERHRQRSESREKQLLLSIMNQGIDEPLHGVVTKSGQVILLDGFKRLRSAIKLGLGAVPFASMGEDEATAIVQLLRVSNAKALSMLEQAAFVEELKRIHGFSVAEIAHRLQKSKAWVLVRLQTLSQMSEKTNEAILSGKFPLYSYLYTLHPFRRLTGVASKQEVDEFVGLSAGRGLSTRDIELLSDAYFRGGDAMRTQLRAGDLGWCLQELKERNRIRNEGSAELKDAEKRMIRDLEIVQGCMGRLSLKIGTATAEGGGQAAFRVQAEVLIDGVLSRAGKFLEVLRGFHDRIREA
jgi:ParB/RepB/Spo0J family partition protein